MVDAKDFYAQTYPILQKSQMKTLTMSLQGFVQAGHEVYSEIRNERQHVFLKVHVEPSDLSYQEVLILKIQNYKIQKSI